MPTLVFAETLKPEEIYARTTPSVVTLQVVNAAGEQFVGSAFLAVTNGVAVTAWHVVSDAVHVTARLSDGRYVQSAGLVDKDEKHDLALIRLETADLPMIKLASATPMVGSRLYAIGAPKGYEFSITDGLLSQIQVVDGFQQYQVSCPISVGNSGGPLINDRGEAVGVTVWTKKDAQNLSFATPVSFLGELNPTKAMSSWGQPQSFTMAKPGANRNSESVRSAASGKREAFKKLMKQSAGREVTVTVDDHGRKDSFTFVVPPELVK